MCAHRYTTHTQNNTLIPGHKWKTSVAPSAMPSIDNRANFRACVEKQHRTKSQIRISIQPCPISGCVTVEK